MVMQRLLGSRMRVYVCVVVVVVACFVFCFDKGLLRKQPVYLPTPGNSLASAF